MVYLRELEPVTRLEIEVANPALQRLVSNSYEVFVLSTGSPRMVRRLIATADLDNLVFGRISVDEMQLCKYEPKLGY